MREFIIAVALLCAAVTGACAQENLWDHNGSIVRSVMNGNHFTIVYEQPRPGMVDEGVMPGTILFEGEFSGANIWGTAYTFALGCPPIPYFVEGSAFSEQENIVLSGAAPVTEGCFVVGHTSESSNSVLLFQFVQ